MFGFDLNEGPDTKMDRRIVREFDRDVSPITLIGDGDFRYDLSNHFGILMDAVGHGYFPFRLGSGRTLNPFIWGMRDVLKSLSKVRIQPRKISATKRIRFRLASSGPIISIIRVAQITGFFFISCSARAPWRRP
jgi:hypothetical protein